MNVGDFLERWGKTLFETPLALASKSDEPPELAEIRLAVLDRIPEKRYRAGGKKVFPYDLLRVEMRGVEDGRRDVFAGRFFRQYIEQEVRAALRDGACRFPDNLRVDIEPVAGLPKPGEAWLIVETASQEIADGAQKRFGRLVIQAGEAN